MFKSYFPDCVRSSKFCPAILCSLLVFLDAHAQNKVVVIPLAGDEVIVEVPTALKPSTPVANVDTSQSDYTIGALTVIDNITRLEWQRQDDDIERNWDNAWSYCAGLELDGHEDWRLPRIKELQSIVDYGQVAAPLIDPVAFTNTNTTFYWSATTESISSSNAWLIFFGVGAVNVFNTGKGNDNIFVRCVR